MAPGLAGLRGMAAMLLARVRMMAVMESFILVL
jgi:hypothetical protein